MRNLPRIFLVALAGCWAGCSAQRDPAVQTISGADPQSSATAARLRGAAGPEDLDSYEKLIAKRDSLGLPESERRRIAAEIGECVFENYRAAQFLSLTAQIVEPPDLRARVDMRMTPDKLKSEIYIDCAETAALVFTLRDGRLQEFSRIDGTPQVVEYPAPMPNGSPDLTLLHSSQRGSEYRCMLGLSAQSWVGPSFADRMGRLLFRGALAEGEYIGRFQDGNSQLDVVLWERRDIDMTDVFVFYVNAQCFLVRWDSFEASRGQTPHLLRTARYTDLRTDPLPDEVWTFLPGALDEATK